MWWFYVLLVVLGGFLAGLVLQNRFKKLQKQQQVKAERLRLEQDLRIARLTALKAQMKPHFIFNVLNSIQSFIYQNKPQDAKAYLGKFSKFMRLALTHSDKEWVNLGEELSMIQNYVDLEAMQLEGGFEYHLSIDDSLKISQLLIPSFLLQPIIENVFKHAFKNKKTLKKLHLKVQDISIDFFKIIVEDNGIGRAKAIQNKQKTPDKHQSFATVAMAEKLTLLNTQSPESIVFSVVDLEDEKENALGTQVNVQLKKNKNDI
jgi:sensor histidine kinase YesM